MKIRSNSELDPTYPPALTSSALPGPTTVTPSARTARATSRTGNRTRFVATTRCAWGSAHAESDTYFFSNFFSNVWLILGKLWEARSRLYRRQVLQVNTRLKALDEICKIYTLLHPSAFKISAKFRQTFSQFNSFILKSSLIFPNRSSFESYWRDLQDLHLCVFRFTHFCTFGIR